MNMSLFAKFNKSIDMENLKKDMEEIKSNSGNTGTREEVPHGTYEVKIDQMELKESKKGNPMLSIWFRVLDGKFKNSIIFYNQALVSAYTIHLACELMRSLDTGVEVDFNYDFEEFAEIIKQVFEKSKDNGLEYALNYSQNDKGYSVYEITDVFEN